MASTRTKCDVPQGSGRRYAALAALLLLLGGCSSSPRDSAPAAQQPTGTGAPPATTSPDAPANHNEI